MAWGLLRRRSCLEYTVSEKSPECENATEPYLPWTCCRYRDQSVAVKIIQQGETADEVAKREARFGREISMLSRVQHKNLVKLYSTVTLRHGDKKHYNHKVDVYSFSIVLWELLMNRLPFEGMSNLQAAYAAAFKGTRPSLSENVDLPDELVFIMQSCWAEDPNVR
eukprot:c16427_g2_i2 orf=1010-1507(+)